MCVRAEPTSEVINAISANDHPSFRHAVWGVAIPISRRIGPAPSSQLLLTLAFVGAGRPHRLQRARKRGRRTPWAHWPVLLLRRQPESGLTLGKPARELWVWLDTYVFVHVSYVH